MLAAEAVTAEDSPTHLPPPPLPPPVGLCPGLSPAVCALPLAPRGLLSGSLAFPSKIQRGEPPTPSPLEASAATFSEAYHPSE